MHTHEPPRLLKPPMVIPLPSLFKLVLSRVIRLAQSYSTCVLNCFGPGASQDGGHVFFAVLQ